MARHGKQPTDDLKSDDLDDLQVSFLADEDAYDRRTPWRLAGWGLGAVGAVVVAVLANQFHLQAGRLQSSAADMSRQSEQLQAFAQENRNDIRRLAAAIDTLNADRDRLFARATSLEQSFESVTGSMSRQTAALSALTLSGHSLATPERSTVKVGGQSPPSSGGPATANTTTAAAEPVKPPVEPLPSPTATTASNVSAPEHLPASSERMEAGADSRSGDVTASIPAAPTPPVVEIAVPRTTFGIDLGAANSLDGLRSLWRKISAAHKSEFADLRPLIALREHKGTAGIQLRLVAGPFHDAAAAARICAVIAASQPGCVTTTFEGQQLAMDVAPAAAAHPPHRRPAARQAKREASPAAAHASSPGTPPTQTR